ncbi:MAG: formyltransferase family protein [Desulfovibrio sp.]
MSTNQDQPKILLLCKKGKESAETAIKHLKGLVPDNLTVYEGVVGSSIPEEIHELEYDYLISYLSPWIIPDTLLKKAKCAAINFHPAPPEYPGTGCFNFALYDEVDQYGATCHHMNPIVDSGKVIAVSRFEVVPEDTVLSVAEKTYTHMLDLFYDIVGIILEGKDLPLAANEAWRGKARTRKELEALCEITMDMDKEEVERRMRATVFPNMPGPRIFLHGYRFNLVEE